ncbi:aminopeptidase [Anaerocolumna sedimenticola]|uniref:Aminopeptidase n=1 Tax=Anaerocolumna sedimenticola TaxID=2696063 RepID=A0A6P1TNA2_9FIRM|nr:aminopeptidase [Anaerocolumna sedimenticola]QHQ61165.1 aminopeptidase [Anaerocolumna sedimenticola]
MKYTELFKESNEEIRERYELSMERIGTILNEQVMKEPVRDYFNKTAEFILKIKELVTLVETDKLSQMTLEDLKKLNNELYEDVIPENYENSFGNPRYAVKKLGKVGKLLSFLYAEIRGMIVYAYECRLFDITIYLELFIEVYNYFEEADDYTYKDVKRAIYDFISDYTGDIIEYRTRELIDSQLSFVNDIIHNWDLKDFRYLYQFGEYIGENELKTAEFLNSLTEEEVKAMAFTYTEGYRRGFAAARIDLRKKRTVNIRYNIGFERMLYYAVEYFAEMGLKPVIYRAAVNTVNKKQHLKIGFHSTGPNKQFDYDHRFDNGLYLDKAYNERKLSGLKKAYEKYKNESALYAGPAVIQVFGEKNFAPENKAEVIKLDKRQQKLYVMYNRASNLITNEYIKGEETSFTIIAYPIPEIGEQFKDIFKETVKVNTLDNQTYKEIQQSIIDVLDQGEYVKILGRGKNRTDLKVMLYELKDPGTETIFENCTADVNIPVGEVFTSPKLTGTEGTLHVTQVYLNELEYIDLALQFEDGKISSYTCRNFTSEDENKQFVKENLMYNQETLPLGEFAIGTNTTAYVMAQKYKIGDKLPILIAEKTGPHFAVGDTCYQMSEDLNLYNPDGKLIVAKDNEISILRKTDMDKAYFNCHTDITIPYDELGEITVYKKNGETITIIKDGRFILPGTEKLNEAFR